VRAKIFRRVDDAFAGFSESNPQMISVRIIPPCAIELARMGLTR